MMTIGGLCWSGIQLSPRIKRKREGENKEEKERKGKRKIVASLPAALNWLYQI